MKNKSFYIYIAAYLSIILPAPGRFVFGFTLMFELLILTIIGTLSDALIKKLELSDMKAVISVFILMATTVLYRQVVVLTYPEVALTLGYLLYLPGISLFMLAYIFGNEETELKPRLIFNLKHVAFFCLSGLFFFILRDILGYGTFTFFAKQHQIVESAILSSDGVGICTFLATIPGGFVLASVALFISTFIVDKFSKIKAAEDTND